MYVGWIKVKRGLVLSADCYPHFISVPNSYARVADRAANNFKGALYRIWCGVNRLGDSGVKLV